MILRENIQDFVLQVGDQSGVGVKWLGGTGRPSEAELRDGGAIPCHLNMAAQSDCYFGQGVYSDGICHEVARERFRVGQGSIFYFRHSELLFLLSEES